MNVDFNWTHVSLFVAVADHGSLSAASRSTGVSQPTIGRAIQALEDSLGVSLFSRHARGLNLTEHGEALIFHARSMAESAANFSLTAAGHSEQLDGPVRISASQIMATYFLPTILAQMRAIEPGIDVEIVATDTIENLLFREADIALRMVRPTQLDLITRHVGDLQMGAYAAYSYLAQQPAPQKLLDLKTHRVIGYDRSTLIIDAARRHGVPVDRDFFSYRCDDQVVCWQLLLAGAGVGFAAAWIAESDDRVVRVLPDLQFDPLPVWLTAHSAMKTNRRVRFVFDYLAAAIEKLR